MSFLDDCDASELVGHPVGPCQVVACLRRGKRTTVYRGWQPDLERAVALKVVNPECLGQANILERFKQEVALSLRLDHPHVVHIYASGEQDYQPYLVMEWVQGHSLQDELSARGHLPPDDAATIAIHIARALDYVHRQGIVHRDVKPSNILLGSDGNARLSDFGIASRIGEAPPTVGVGTSAYLAPEQVSKEPADPHSDIYSLGIVMFEMLTGRVPFEADDELGMITHHLYTPPPPLHRFVSGLGMPWERLITQALMKKPWERQADARALIAQIELAARPRLRL
jgi:serine/threonine-protein kinase